MSATPVQPVDTQAPLFVLEKVNTQATLRKEWYPLLLEIFPDKDDQSPIEELIGYLKEPKNNTFYLLRDVRTGKAVGIELRQINPDIPGSMYLPWAGVTEPYRNKGIYPYMAAICDQQMREVGAKYCLFEVEDPKRIHVAYPDDTPEEVTRMTEGRINFWRRATGSYIVRDTTIDYVRPASSDERMVQAYDLMAIRVFDDKDPMWRGVFNEDKTAISKDFYRRAYMEMTRLQYGNLSEAALKKQLPAVKQMLDVLDQSPRQWLTLQTGDTRPKLSLDQEAHVVPVATSRHRRMAEIKALTGAAKAPSAFAAKRRASPKGPRPNSP